LFGGEQSLLKALVRRAAAAIESQARVNALADHIARNPENTNHWVIFCTAPCIADKLYAYLKTRFGPGPVLRHSLDETQWYRFHYADAFTVLICDGRAEEGLNLQGHEAVLVHFDLPLSPGRIEQRMGRLDRFSRGDPVRSIVLCSDDNPWEEAWLSLMNDGLGVFNESIASLQYSTAGWIDRGSSRSFEIGSDAWTELALQLAGEKGEVAREKRLIAEQDAMDFMDLSVDSGDAFVDRLRALETPAFIQSFSESLVTWGKQALNIQMYEEDRNHPGVFRLLFFEDWTLIPERLFRAYFAGALDSSSRPPPWARDRRASSRPMSFSRSVAQQRRSLVARYGEKFLDALYDYTRDDDRGRCYALWRCRENIPQKIEGAYIRLEFVIEADDSEALAVTNGVADPLAIRREADALLPPFHVGFWLDADHEFVTDAAVLNFLSASLVRPTGPGQAGDFDLDPRRWAALSKESVFRDWHTRLRKSLQFALAQIPKRPEVKQHIAHSKASAEDRLRDFESQMTSRLTVLPDDSRATEAEQLEMELAWRRALIASIASPRLLIDSAGVIVLDHRSFKS
jgi:ATP-dependent helicase HepA